MEAALVTAQSATHEDTEKLIYRMAWWAVDHLGFEFDEALSEANLAWSIAWRTYDPGRGASFVTWLWHQIKGRLLSRKKRDAHRAVRLPTEPAVMERLPGAEGRMDRLLTDLGEDARVVIWVIISSCGPHDVRNPAGCRANLCRVLKEAGWTVARVVESFAEIREALG